MINEIVLGSIQGIFEWLPVSSEAVLVLAQTHLLGESGAVEMIGKALFLHLGTFFAALIYFRKEVWRLVESIFNYSNSDLRTKKVLKFLIVSTLISGGLGLLLIGLIGHLETHIEFTGKLVTGAIGVLLLGTGVLQIKSEDSGARDLDDLESSDGIILGLAQGLAALPGFSRSGLTVSILLLRKINESASLRLSFLMSLPIVFLGNLVLNFNSAYFSLGALAGLLASFLFGIATIHLLLKVARKINFGLFVLGFGVLAILAALI